MQVLPCISTLELGGSTCQSELQLMLSSFVHAVTMCIDACCECTGTKWLLHAQHPALLVLTRSCIADTCTLFMTPRSLIVAHRAPVHTCRA
jgi:hypothetical protein